MTLEEIKKHRDLYGYGRHYRTVNWLIAEVERLQGELNCVANGLWTQTEIDAAKYRAKETMKELGWDVRETARRCAEIAEGVYVGISAPTRIADAIRKEFNL